MQPRYFLLIMTYVLFSASAHATTQTKYKSSPPSAEQAEEKKEEEKGPSLEGMTIVQPPPSTKKARTKAQISPTDENYYYYYEKSLAVRLGLLVDPDEIRDKKKLIYLFGFQLHFQVPEGIEWEVGADLVSDSIGRVHASRRWTFFPNEALRPFFKAGLNCRLLGSEKLATFANSKNYQFKFGVGLEDLIDDPMSVRVDFEGQVGFKHQDFLVAIGSSWAW